MKKIILISIVIIAFVFFFTSCSDSSDNKVETVPSTTKTVLVPVSNPDTDVLTAINHGPVLYNPNLDSLFTTAKTKDEKLKLWIKVKNEGTANWIAIKNAETARWISTKNKATSDWIKTRDSAFEVFKVEDPATYAQYAQHEKQGWQVLDSFKRTINSAAYKRFENIDDLAWSRSQKIDDDAWKESQRIEDIAWSNSQKIEDRAWQIYNKTK